MINPTNTYCFITEVLKYLVVNLGSIYSIGTFIFAFFCVIFSLIGKKRFQTKTKTSNYFTQNPYVLPTVQSYI